MAKKQQAHLATIAPKAMEEIGAQPLDIRREKTKSGNFFSVYVNDIQVQTVPWDVRMVLGEISSTADTPPVLSIEELGQIRMSPQLAKKLTIIMAKQLRTYEEKFGEIPGPTD